MNRRGTLLLLAVAILLAAVGLLPRGGDETPEATPLADDTVKSGAEVSTAATRVPTSSGRTEPVLRGTADEASSPPNPVLVGRVVDRATGKGIEGARVILHRPDGGEDLLGRTDADGRFRMTFLPSFPWTVLAAHPLYVPASKPWREARVIELDPGVRIEGRVVGPTGDPVPGVSIRLAERGRVEDFEDRFGIWLCSFEEYVPVKTDTQGRFALAFLDREMEAVRLGAAGAGWVGRWSEPIELDPEAPPKPVVLEVVRAATVSGRVRREDGTPVHPASVELDWDVRWEIEKTWAYRAWDVVEVDGSGAYVMRGLPPTRLSLAPSWDEPHMQGPPRALEPLAPGEIRVGVDLVLPTRYILQGRLQSEAGEPLPNERLRIRARVPGEDAVLQEIHTTRRGGTFHLTLPTPGPLEIVHLSPTGHDRILRHALRLPAEDLVLVSNGSPIARLEVRVRTADGATVPRFNSQVWSARTHAIPYANVFESREDGRQGSARHEVLGEAPFEVRVSCARDEEGRPFPLGLAQVRLDVAPADGQVEVVLPPEGEVWGRVVGPDGKPVAGVRVVLVESVDDQASRRTAVPLDRDGRFRVRQVKGEFTHRWLEFEVPEQFALVDVMGAPPGTRLGAIVLQPAGVLAGRIVRASDGAAPPGVAGIPVTVTWKTSHGRGSVEVVANADTHGRWRAAQVPLDTDLRVHVPDHVVRWRGYIPPAPLTGLRAGDDVSIPLEPGLSITGRCLEADGSAPPAEHVCVCARSATGADKAWSGVSSPEGRFVIRGLAPGVHRLTIEFEDAEYPAGEAEAGATGVEIRLPARGTIRIELEGRKPDAEYGVDVWLAGTTTLRGCGYVEGPEPIQVTELPAHEVFDVVVRDLDGHVGTAAGVRTGDEVKITMVPALPLGGRLRASPLPEGLGDHTLYAVRKGACFELYVCDDGEFGCDEGAAPGKYELHLVAEDGTTTVIAKDVEAGRTDLELELD